LLAIMFAASAAKETTPKKGQKERKKEEERRQLEGLGWTRVVSVFVLVVPFSLEEQDMWLGFMDHIVFPPVRLHNAQAPPLGLGQQAPLGHKRQHLLGQNNMSERNKHKAAVNAKGERRKKEEKKEEEGCYLNSKSSSA